MQDFSLPVATGNPEPVGGTGHPANPNRDSRSAERATGMPGRAGQTFAFAISIRARGVCGFFTIAVNAVRYTPHRHLDLLLLREEGPFFSKYKKTKEEVQSGKKLFMVWGYGSGWVP